jgi:hypothetical protein
MHSLSLRVNHVGVDDFNHGMGIAQRIGEIEVLPVATTSRLQQAKSDIAVEFGRETGRGNMALAFSWIGRVR